MIGINIDAPHDHLEVQGNKGQSHRFYMPWKPDEEIVNWLVQHCHSPYLVMPLVELSYEQGVGELPMFRGLKFIFEDHDEAMLFKLTWA